MLIGTLNHVKVKRLKKLLGKPLYCCMGILESIWQLCMECCDDGNIGKFTNEEIADHIEWDGELVAKAMAFTENDTPIAQSIELDCMNDLRDGKPCHKWYQSTWQPVRDAIVKWCVAKVQRPPSSHSFKMQGLSSSIFDSNQVESMCKAARDMSRDKLEEMFVRLCLSHERLQQELEGVDAMLRDEKAYASDLRKEVQP